MNCWGTQRVSCLTDGVPVPLAGEDILEFNTEAGKTYHFNG